MLRKFAFAMLAVAFAFTAAIAARGKGSNTVSSDWRNARQISPAELAKKISGPAKMRPVVLQVGFKVLYDGGHIPGAIFAGPASTAEGLAKLKAVAENIPRNKEVILYCGCCPWEKCPNVHPAYDELRRMGFSRLVVLLIPQDFAHDWIGQGFPVAREK
ncbi:MAG: rhodanese-like domain-containing protein [Candidatus Acidiferrales bacterium]